MTLRSPRVALTIFTLALLASPSRAGAQTADPDWARLRAQLAPGETVRVQVDQRQEHEGIVESISETGLTLREAGQPIRLDSPSVMRVLRKGDSLKNGAAIGGVIGAVGSAVLGGVTIAICRNEGGVNCPTGRVLALVGPLAAGLAIGIGLDAMKEGSTTLYRRRARVAIGPVVAPGTRAMQAGISW